MKVLKESELTNTKSIALAFVEYDAFFTLYVYIGKSDQGFTAVNCVDSEFSNKYFVYGSLRDLIYDYYVKFGYMVSVCNDSVTRALLDSMKEERRLAMIES
jgi:hypothetical protein